MDRDCRAITLAASRIKTHHRVVVSSDHWAVDTAIGLGGQINLEHGQAGAATPRPTVPPGPGCRPASRVRRRRVKKG
eukprot:scaffold9622_cov113-Isochrysis_galbana.AAC.7